MRISAFFFYRASRTEAPNDSSPRVAVSHVPVMEKKKTAQEFAKYMQEVRLASIGQSDVIDRSAASLFTLANQFMHEVPPVQKLSLRDVSGCTSIVPVDNSTGFCPMVLSNGRRLYLCERNVSITGNESVEKYHFDPYNKNLLSVSYDDLTRQVDELQTQARILHSRLNEQKVAADRASKRKTQTLADRKDTELWVDKYAPSSFTQVSHRFLMHVPVAVE